jgi:hypothetical protein
MGGRSLEGVGAEDVRKQRLKRDKDQKEGERGRHTDTPLPITFQQNSLGNESSNPGVTTD